MISVNEAKQIIENAEVTPVVSNVPMQEAAGYILASPVYAITDIPAFVQSSMDGYAFKFAEINERFQIIGEMAAGARQQFTITSSQAARIFTGAPLPEGADTVVMQEKVTVKDGKLFINDDEISMGSNVRGIGAEVKNRELAMDSATVLTPAALGFLAGIGITHVDIFAPPVVTIILTGNELQEPGLPLSFGQVYEANSVLLTAALTKAGVKKIKVLKSEDVINALKNVLTDALITSDIVLLTGGVSVGDYDFVVQATELCGVDKLFHRIKQKPGKPLYFGKKENKMVFGLPGNPSSVLTCFYEYVLPALEKTKPKNSSVIATMAVATHHYTKPTGLTHFLKASYNNGKVTPLHAQESFRLHSFAQANCFIVLDEDSTGCKTGEEVTIHLLPV